ncbi:hypothetical protein D6833_00400 [Candidatus Parcubacteria bacterium]|nr:MAG: hypothetical protein D6833_00400 [Candidatus Parcubacteria bacterium]
MATATGTLVKAVFEKDPQTSSYPYTSWTWPLSNNDRGIPLMSEDVTITRQKEEDMTLQERAGLKKADVVGVEVSGSLELQGKYNGLGRLVAMAMGFENPNDPGATYHGSPEQVGSLWKHVLELDEELATQGWLAGDERFPSGSGGGTWTANDKKVRRGVLGFRKQVIDHVIYSAFVNKMTIKITPGRISFGFDMIGYNAARTNAQSSNWDLPTYQANLIWPDCEFMIGSVDGTTMTWQEIGITEATIELNNNLDVVRDTKSGLYITEPARQQKRVVTCSFSLARYEDDALLDRYDNDTEMKCWFKFTRGNYQFNIYFPSFTLSKASAPVGGPELIKPTYEFTAYKPSSDPFTNEWGNIELKKNNEMVILMINDDGSNYFTES